MVHRLNRACRPCAKPSSISSFNHDLSDARTAEDKSPKRNGMNKSAKVVLGHGLIHPGASADVALVRHSGDEPDINRRLREVLLRLRFSKGSVPGSILRSRCELLHTLK